MKRYGTLIFGCCLLLGAMSSISAGGNASVPANKPGISVKTALLFGAAVGFGANIISDKYVQPNLKGLSFGVLPVYVLMRATDQQTENYVLVGYTVGAATAKSIWVMLNCVKEKLRRLWNS